MNKLDRGTCTELASGQQFPVHVCGYTDQGTCIDNSLYMIVVTDSMPLPSPTRWCY